MKKILVSILIIAAVSISFVGYQYSKGGNSTSNKEQAKRANKPIAAKARKADSVQTAETTGSPMITMSSNADMAVFYTSLNDLVQTADVIIEGVVTNVSYFEFNTITNTRALVRVTKSYTSNAKEGDVLTFVDPGGITTEAAMIRYSGNKFNRPIGKAEENTKVQVLLNGAPLTKVGEKVVYFAKKSVLFQPDMYVSIGAYQGKFTISSDGTAQRYVPKGDESSRYNSLKMTKAKFDQQLANAVKNKK